MSMELQKVFSLLQFPEIVTFGSSTPRKWCLPKCLDITDLGISTLLVLVGPILGLSHFSSLDSDLCLKSHWICICSSLLRLLSLRAEIYARIYSMDSSCMKNCLLNSNTKPLTRLVLSFCEGFLSTWKAALYDSPRSLPTSTYTVC